MTANDLQALLPSLEMFHRRFGRFFVRSEARAWSQKYLIGLTLPIERKNVENIAEQVGAPPRKLQEFLSDSPWDQEGCVEELQGFVGEQMGSADGVLILDDTRPSHESPGPSRAWPSWTSSEKADSTRWSCCTRSATGGREARACWAGWGARLGDLSRPDARRRSAMLRRGRHRALDVEDARGGSLRIGLTGGEPRDH